jgi:hypothetical protein
MRSNVRNTKPSQAPNRKEKKVFMAVFYLGCAPEVKSKSLDDQQRQNEKPSGE